MANKKVFILKQTPLKGKKTKAGSTVTVDSTTAKLLVATKKGVYEDDMTDEHRAFAKKAGAKGQANAKSESKASE